MVTVDSVIDSLGGTKAVALALDVSPSTVSVWRVRGIPSAHWLKLVRLAGERGKPDVTLEALAELSEADGARA